MPTRLWLSTPLANRTALEPRKTGLAGKAAER